MSWLYDSGDFADGNLDGLVSEKDLVRVIHVSECRHRCELNGGDCCDDDNDDGDEDVSSRV